MSGDDKYGDREHNAEMQALGLHRGQRVHLLRRGWWAGPLHLRIGMTELMLRRADAARVGIDHVAVSP